MENKKLISLRLEPETLTMIDQLADKASYRSRSSVIQNILDVVLKCSDPGTLWRIIDKWLAYEKGYVIKFERNEDVWKERNLKPFDNEL